MTKEDYVRRARAHLEGSANVKSLVADRSMEEILAASELFADSFASGSKLLLCGNGGSAADCQHMAAEFVSRLSPQLERPGLPAIAPTTDTSFLTDNANDYAIEGVFERQVQALGRAGDVLTGISTSGGSRNVVLAPGTAKSLGLRTIALTGRAGKVPEVAEVAIRVPSDNPQHIQESHLVIEHVMCDLVEQRLFGEKPEARGERPGAKRRLPAALPWAGVHPIPREATRSTGWFSCLRTRTHTRTRPRSTTDLESPLAAHSHHGTIR